MAAGTTLLSRDSCSLAMAQIHRALGAALNMNPGGGCHVSGNESRHVYLAKIVQSVGLA